MPSLQGRDFLERQLKLKAEKSKGKNASQEEKLSHHNKSAQRLSEENLNPVLEELDAKDKLGSILDSSDDEEDMLIVKRKNHDIENQHGLIDTSLEEKAKTKAKGPLSKAAVAKKVLKKGIIANLVTKFDEDGDAIENVNTQKISQEGRDYDGAVDTTNESAKGGINLEEAARILKAEDRYDVQIEREKIRMRKREEKRKAKEAKQKKEQQSKDEQSDEEFESEDNYEDEPDLDWLPDPDKIYGPENEDKESTDIASKEQIDDIDVIGAKRKWKPPKSNKSKKAKIVSDSNDNNCHSDLLNNEELALQLLNR